MHVIRRKIATAAVVMAAVGLPAVLGLSTSANAATSAGSAPIAHVTRSAALPAGSSQDGYISFGDCNADITLQWTASTAYAHGNFYLGTYDECEGWLERIVYNSSTNTWGSWYRISGIHVGTPVHQSTDKYWDDAGYRARACIGFSTAPGEYVCGASG
jgi:hypothetical protein